MPETAPPVRRILLIGIDRYPSMNSLHGCVNDIDAMELFLRKRMGVRTESIRKLASAHPRARPPGLVPEQLPTRQAILDALGKLRDEAQAGDRILVFYSGHGTQRLQSTLVIEGLVPMDSALRGDIWDFELNPLLASIADKKADVTVILDCCQSAGATRGEAEGEGADRVTTTTGPLPSLPAQLTARRRLVAVGDTAAPPFIVVAACQSDEKAKEQPSGSNTARGVFSSSLLERLTERADLDGAAGLEALRWGDVWDGLRGTVTERSPAQHPWLIGRSERRIFGGPWHEEDIGISVRQDGELYRLGAGTMTNVAPGAVLAVYGRANLIARADAPDEPRFFPPLADMDSRALTLEVIAATPGSATAKWRGGRRNLPDGARARIVEPASGDELVVRLRPYDQSLATWLEAQRDPGADPAGPSSPLFKTVDANAGAAEAYVDIDDDRFSLGDALHGPGGEPPLATGKGWNELLAALRHFAHYNLAFRLLARCNDPVLANALVVRIRDCNGATALAVQNPHNPAGLPELTRDAQPAPAGRPRFTYRVPDGQLGCVSVTNTSDTRLYVTVFDCPSSGRVQVIGANVEIPAGKTDTFWWRSQLRQPIGFWIGTRGAMVERYIVVGTTNPEARLDGLESQAGFDDVLRQVRGDRDSGPGSRDLGTPADPRERWTATLVSIKLEPRQGP